MSVTPARPQCEAGTCDNDATLWHICTTRDCDNRLEFFVCDVHAAPNGVCNGCVEVLTTIHVGSGNGAAAASAGLYDDLEEGEEPITPRTQSASCASGRVVHDSALAVTVAICGGAEETVLGHNFADMRKVERSLRAWAGISATASAVSGPNTAIAELRILLTGEDCEQFEFAFRLCDDRERMLVFRSTAASVLAPPAEVARLAALDTAGALSPGEDAVLKEYRACTGANQPLVRCFAEDENSGYSLNGKYAMTGAYSFFVPPDDDVAVAASQHALQHRGGYRDLVEGPANAEGYHHSEQTLFHALFHHPELLYDAIDIAFLQELLPDGPLTLEAVSIDVFTTRQACGGCMTAAAKVLDDPRHFMAQALLNVAAQDEDIDVTNVRKFIRFDCDYAFQSTVPDLRKNSAILHGVPGQAIPSATAPFEILYIPIPSNVSDLLLDNGSALTYTPRSKTLLVALDRIGNLPASIRELAAAFRTRLQQAQCSGFHEFVFILAWYVKKWCTANAALGSVLAGEVTDETMSARAQLIGCRAYYMVSTALEFFKLTERSQATATAQAVLGCTCAATEIGADILNEETMTALRYAFAKHRIRPDMEALMNAVHDKMKERIDALLTEAESGEAAADNAARTLAIQYDLLNYYRTKIAQRGQGT
jgi:hypothetical protein